MHPREKVVGDELLSLGLTGWSALMECRGEFIIAILEQILMLKIILKKSAEVPRGTFDRFAILVEPFYLDVQNVTGAY